MGSESERKRKSERDARARERARGREGWTESIEWGGKQAYGLFRLSPFSPSLCSMDPTDQLLDDTASAHFTDSDQPATEEETEAEEEEQKEGEQEEKQEQEQEEEQGVQGGSGGHVKERGEGGGTGKQERAGEG